MPEIDIDACRIVTVAVGDSVVVGETVLLCTIVPENVSDGE